MTGAGGCENVSWNTFSRNTKTAIPSDGIAFSLNSRQPWDCGCKEFPLHCSLRPEPGLMAALLSSDHHYRTELIFRYLVSELPVHKCRVSHRAGLRRTRSSPQRDQVKINPDTAAARNTFCPFLFPACGELWRY